MLFEFTKWLMFLAAILTTALTLYFAIKFAWENDYTLSACSCILFFSSMILLLVIWKYGI